MTYARRAITADIEQIIAMAKLFHAESPAHSPYPFNEAKVAALVAAAIASPEWCPVVAVDDDGLVGMALIYAMPMYFSDALEGGDLAFYVPKGRRGSLAAAHMMQFIETWLVSVGVAVTTIGINTGINHDTALSFFVKCGYRPSGLIVRK